MLKTYREDVHSHHYIAQKSVTSYKCIQNAEKHNTLGTKAYKVNALNDKCIRSTSNFCFLCREKNSANKIAENEQVFPCLLV